MRAEFRDGQLVVLVPIKEKDNLEAMRALHAERPLLECWAEWEHSPKIAKLTFKPVYVRKS